MKKNLELSHKNFNLTSLQIEGLRKREIKILAELSKITLSEAMSFLSFVRVEELLEAGAQFKLEERPKEEHLFYNRENLNSLMLKRLFDEDIFYPEDLKKFMRWYVVMKTSEKFVKVLEEELSATFRDEKEEILESEPEYKYQKLDIIEGLTAEMLRGLSTFKITIFRDYFEKKFPPIFSPEMIEAKEILEEYFAKK